MEKRLNNVKNRKKIKDYFYLRNGLLHRRYTVDDCIVLTESETARMKECLEDWGKHPNGKQEYLAMEWEMLTKGTVREIMDGIRLVDDRLKAKRERLSPAHTEAKSIGT